MKTKITFIILQYKVFEETFECVDSIEKSIGKKDYEIVIIDNGSGNGAYEKVKGKFKEDKKVHIITLEDNVGFSKGNNIGYAYANKKFNPDFYCIINNDTLINQKNWVKLIEREYKNSKFDVLGPDIINLKGVHQNSLNLFPTPHRIKRLIFENKLRFIFEYIHLGNFFENTLRSFKDEISKKKKSSQYLYSTRKENTALHGSALIFSKKFFKEMQKPFFPEVFLYGEEEILNYNRVLKKLKFVYCPWIKVIHKEDKTSDLISKSNRKRNLFKTKNSIVSFKILLKYMKKNPLT